MNSWDEQGFSFWVARSLLLKHVFLSVTHSSRIDMRFRSLESCRQCLFDLLLWTYDSLFIKSQNSLKRWDSWSHTYASWEVLQSLSLYATSCSSSLIRSLLSLLVFILTSFLSLLVSNLTSLLDLLMLNLTSLARSVLMLLLFRVICKDLSYTDWSCLARVNVFIHLVALTVYLFHSY